MKSSFLWVGLLAISLKINASVYGASNIWACVYNFDLDWIIENIFKPMKSVLLLKFSKVALLFNDLTLKKSGV